MSQPTACDLCEKPIAGAVFCSRVYWYVGGQRREKRILACSQRCCDAAYSANNLAIEVMAS